MEHLFIVTYDVRDPRRWKRLFDVMKGYGEWLQLSVFQCRLDAMRRLRLEEAVSRVVKTGEDHVLILDLGPADRVSLKVQSIGKRFEPVRREPWIV